MPTKPRTPCPVPGCPALTNGGTCEQHTRQREAIRTENGAKSYRTTRWQRRRKAFIYSNPWCVLCAKAANVADHFPLSRKDLLAKGVSDPDSAKHLRPLCTSCHNKETAQHQPGGWAHEAKAKRMMRIDPPPF